MAENSTLSNDEKLARHRLIRTNSVGPITFRHLLERYGSAEKALEAIPELAKKGKRKSPLKPPSADSIIKELKALKPLGGRCLHLGDTGYPALLAHIDDAPPILYGRGNFHLLEKDGFGIVGARNASASGMQLTRAITQDLSESEIVIVSGLARGIDTVAHKSALKGGTIACMAGGLDVVYPKENQDLYDAIADAGLLLTEMPLTTQPQARHFPRRNRLISGLSLGVMVVEAAERSGSLITARFALEQGREVFAVPGSPADPRARGTNRLIKDGAVLVQSAADIMNELSNLKNRDFSEPGDDTPLFSHSADSAHSDSLSKSDRDTLISLLSPTPCQIDEIIRESQMPVGAVLAVILELELAGRAVRSAGNQVSLLSSPDDFNSSDNDLFS